MTRLLVFAALLAATISGAARAGEQYVDQTGYAVSGYDVVSYFGLQQAAVGKPQPRPAAGKASITADYNGATFAFSTRANRDAFAANPAGYAPQYDGHCAYGVAQGSKVPGNPFLWRIVEGKLYLNITTDVVETWEEDIPGYLTKAREVWAGLETASASRAPIPDFASAAPVAN